MLECSVKIEEEWFGRNVREQPDEREIKTLYHQDIDIDGRSASKVLRELMAQYPLSFGDVHHGEIWRAHDRKVLACFQDSDTPDDYVL